MAPSRHLQDGSQCSLQHWCSESPHGGGECVNDCSDAQECNLPFLDTTTNECVGQSGTSCHADGQQEFCRSDGKCKPNGDCSGCGGGLEHVDETKHECAETAVAAVPSGPTCHDGTAGATSDMEYCSFDGTCKPNGDCTTCGGDLEHVDETTHKCAQTAVVASAATCPNAYNDGVFCPTDSSCYPDGDCSSCGSGLTAAPPIGTSWGTCVAPEARGSVCYVAGPSPAYFCPTDLQCHMSDCNSCGGNLEHVDRTKNECGQSALAARYSGATCHADGGKEYCAADDTCKPDGNCTGCVGNYTNIDETTHNCVVQTVRALTEREQKIQLCATTNQHWCSTQTECVNSCANDCRDHEQIEQWQNECLTYVGKKIQLCATTNQNWCYKLEECVNSCEINCPDQKAQHAERNECILNSGATCHAAGGKEFCAADGTCKPDGNCSSCADRKGVDETTHECKFDGNPSATTCPRIYNNGVFCPTDGKCYPDEDCSSCGSGLTLSAVGYQDGEQHGECVGGSTATAATAATGSVRVVNGDRAHGAPNGRVEVFRNGAWGTVCDDSFDQLDATVVCRSLGCPAGTTGEARDGAAFGQGIGNIWMDDLECSGSEANVFSCPYSESHNCHHGEDAGTAALNACVISSRCDRMTCKSVSTPCLIRASLI